VKSLRELRWRRTALVAIGLAAGFAVVAFWALAELRRGPVAVPIEGRPIALPVFEPGLALARASFDELPGWRADRLAEALPALAASCRSGVRGAAGPLAVAGRLDLWRAFCGRLAALGAVGDDGLRAFFERELEVFALSDGRRRDGLLTGYYEPELRGSRRRRGRFLHPLYLDPGDQIVVDLGDFKRDLAGRRITGIIRRGRFRPYWDRAEIESGALARRGLELLWVDDPVAAFFLQIQGSGRVVLPDGEVVRVGYAGQNGHDYTAIGRVLVERGELELDQVSLQSIRAWLRGHPERADEVMNANRSFVFFRRLSGGGPRGASGVELTAGRSLAIDDDHLPYGVPLWLESTTPAVTALGRVEAPLARLVVAQDTGGAIRGPVRGDLFLGPGLEAEELAGHMKQPLRLWLLAPRGAVAAVAAVAAEAAAR
jgi:membrane-bound lytic murein transglycosylase A